MINLEHQINRIICGDCLEVMKTFPSESVDLVTTDPPYGYSFMGKDWDKAVPSVDIWKETLRVLKSGAFAFIMSSPRQDVLCQMIVRLGQAGFETGFTSIYWTYASGFPKAMNVGKKTKKEELNGSYGGFQPKPAVEVIIVCMKPLAEKTFVDQALRNGKSVSWLNDARIPFEEGGSIAENPLKRKQIGAKIKYGVDANPSAYALKSKSGEMNIDDRGRFPANLLVSDDVLNDGTISKSSGRFSRYFDLDKWFSKQIELLPESVRKTFPFLIVPKASKAERNKGCEGLPEQERSYMSNANGTGETWHPIDDKTGKERDRFKVLSKNIHPTVKPLKLMSYLVTLGSRPKEVVLDPFCGSGTTCLAAEILNRKWIGIDINLEYCEIARKRIGHLPEKLESFG